MKTRLLTVFVLVLSLALILTWAVVAQGPGDVEPPDEGGPYFPETYSGEAVQEDEAELTPPPPPQPERGQRPPLPSGDFGLQATGEAEMLGAGPLGLGGGDFDVSYFFDGMESGAGSWTASGLWHIAGSGDTYQNAYNGDASWWYGQESSGNYDTAATNSGSIKTGPIAIPTDAAAAWLRFWSWEYTEADWGNTYDTRKVYTSTNGTDWTQVWQSNTNNDRAQWYEALIDLSSEAGKSIYLRFEFDTVDSSNNGYRGWYLDDVAVGYDRIQLFPTTQTGYGLPGNTVGYPWSPPGSMWVQNNTGVATAFTITATGVWTPSFGTFTGSINPGQMWNFGGSVQIPAGAALGDYDDTTLTFTSQSTPTLTNDQTVRTWAGWVHRASHQIIDDGSGNSQGDGDGKIDVGETVELVVTLKNDLDRTAYRVYAWLGDSAGLWWYDSWENYGDIAAGATSDSFGRYWFNVPVPPTIQPGQVITFSLNTQAHGGWWSETFTETVDYGVYLEPDSSDGGDPGETVIYHLTLENWTGSASSFDLSASGNSWTTVISPDPTGSVAHGASTPVTVSVTIPLTAQKGDSDEAVIQASGNGRTVTATVETGVLCTPRHVWSGSRSGTGSDYYYPYYSGELFARVSISATTNDWGYLQVYDSWSWTLLYSDYMSGTRQVQLAYAPALYSQLYIYIDDGGSGAGWAYDYVFETCYECVQLTPSSYNITGPAGSTVTRTFTLRNNTGVTTTFDLALTGASWISVVTPTRTITLPEGNQTTCQVVVDIPGSANVADLDTATLRASSVASPTLDDTAALTTTALSSGWYQAYWEDYPGTWWPDYEAYLDSVNSFAEWQLTDDRDSQYDTAVSAFYVDRIPYAWERSRSNPYGVWIYEVEFGARDVTGAVVISTTRVADHGQATDTIYDYDPAIAVDPVGGNIGLAWYRQDRASNTDPWRYNVYYAVYDEDGNVVQSPTALTSNIDNTVQDYSPAIEAYRDGSFAVAWEHYVMTDSISSIYYAALGRNGRLVKSPTELTPNTGDWDDFDPRLAQMLDGNVMVVWEGELYNTGTRETAYALLSPGGSVAQGETSLLTGATTGYQENPDAVALSDGSVVLAWTMNSQIYYAVLSSTNSYAAVVTPTLLYNPMSSNNWNVSLTEDEDGRAVFTWRDNNTGDYIYYALVDGSGNVVIPPAVYRQARNNNINVNYKGYGNGGMEARPLVKVYLPLVFRSY